MRVRQNVASLYDTHTVVHILGVADTPTAASAQMMTTD